MDELEKILIISLGQSYIRERPVGEMVAHALAAILAWHNAEVDRIIGEVDERPKSGPQRNGTAQAVRHARNSLRAEQHARKEESV